MIFEKCFKIALNKIICKMTLMQLPQGLGRDIFTMWFLGIFLFLVITLFSYHIFLIVSLDFHFLQVVFFLLWVFFFFFSSYFFLGFVTRYFWGFMRVWWFFGVSVGMMMIFLSLFPILYFFFLFSSFWHAFFADLSTIFFLGWFTWIIVVFCSVLDSLDVEVSM